MSDMNGAAQQFVEGFKAIIQEVISPLQTDVTEMKKDIICINKNVGGIQGDIVRIHDRLATLENPNE